MAAAGCFTPPPPPPPAKLEKNQLELQLPYDLAWEAVNDVVINNGYRISAHDPNNGILEVQVDHGEFTLKDADCGRIRSIVVGFSAKPAEVSSAVYNFYVKPTGPRTSLVTVTATFSAPVQVPFRPIQSVECSSRGVEEARLLKELAQQAAITHRATYESPAEAAADHSRPPAAGASSGSVSATDSIRRRSEPDLSAPSPGFGSPEGSALLGMPNLPSFPQAAPALGPNAAPKAAATP